MTDAEARERAAALLADAGIVLTAAERAEIEVADFGLGRLEETGLQIVVYVNTERVCAKELVRYGVRSNASKCVTCRPGSSPSVSTTSSAPPAIASMARA